MTDIKKLGQIIGIVDIQQMKTQQTSSSKFTQNSNNYPYFSQMMNKTKSYEIKQKIP